MKSYFTCLTHWGQVMHICVSKLTIIASDNGLSPDRRQAIIWTNAGLFLIGHLGTNFNEILIEILTFSFKKMHLKVLSANWRPFCLGLNELMLTSEYQSKDGGIALLLSFSKQLANMMCDDQRGFSLWYAPLNACPPSAPYMCQWMKSALVQIMACCLFGAEPLSEPNHGYCQ